MNKCQAKGGPETCTNPKCPERTPHFAVPLSYKTLALKPTSTPTPGAWTDKDTVLFKTIHGSTLYGLNHSQSDEDYYVVTPTRYVARASRKNNVRQSISGDLDTVFIDFKTFTRLASEGVPQALEAMYSRKSESPFFEDYRTHYFSSDPTVLHTYMRTMKSFSLTEGEPKTVFKRRRHALRLALNMQEMLYTGRFNPTLKTVEAERITKYAGYETNQYFTELKALSLLEVDWEPEADI